MSKKAPSKAERDKEKKDDQTIAELKEKLRIISLLPGDFRDCEPGSPEWKAYQDNIPESKEAMRKWAHGPVLCFGKEPHPFEIELLKKGHDKIMTVILEPAECTLQVLVDILMNAESAGISFIYVKGFPLAITRSINWLASYFKLRVRAKHEFGDLSKPKPRSFTPPPSEDEEDEDTTDPIPMDEDGDEEEFDEDAEGDDEDE